MNGEQLTSFNLHLAKQCRQLTKFTDYKKLSLTYSKSNSSTSSYFNSELDDDLDLDENTENSNDTCLTTSSTLIYETTKFNEDENLKKSTKSILNESSLYRSKINTRHRTNQKVQKRRAANLRERKRMESINYAFEVSFVY